MGAAFGDCLLQLGLALGIHDLIDIVVAAFLDCLLQLVLALGLTVPAEGRLVLQLDQVDPLCPSVTAPSTPLI